MHVFNCVHWTIYCYVLKSTDWTWEIYEQHNTADNDRVRRSENKVGYGRKQTTETREERLLGWRLMLARARPLRSVSPRLLGE